MSSGDGDYEPLGPAEFAGMLQKFVDKNLVGDEGRLEVDKIDVRQTDDGSVEVSVFGMARGITLVVSAARPFDVAWALVRKEDA